MYFQHVRRGALFSSNRNFEHDPIETLVERNLDIYLGRRPGVK